ncbi:MAG: Asp23/Gls24 family envelope stress response protein [Anaerovorax sp.]
MKIYGLVGKSGTGKSYQAMNLCRDKHIESIIDDGLFICRNRIMAGISAKRQSTVVAAIKTALFIDDTQCQSVTEKIDEVNPQSILVLGTSEKMIYRIVERLSLPPLEEMISIESITTEKEREAAAKQRKELGKHIIPVPTFQIKREFSGYFVDPLRIFKGWRSGKPSFTEKSVVRPTFSYLGGYTISDKVISDITVYIGYRTEGVNDVLKVSVENKEPGVQITVAIIVDFGMKIVDVAKDFQKKVIAKVEMMTAFSVTWVDIEVKGVK